MSLRFEDAGEGVIPLDRVAHEASRGMNQTNLIGPLRVPRFSLVKCHSMIASRS